MIKKFKNHLTTQLPFLGDKKIIVAVSGGVDSVVLVHLFHELKYNIALAHCNFKLRGINSDLDQEFVTSLGKKLNIKTYSKSFETEAYSKKKKLSIQLSARELRYKWFNELRKQHEFDVIATAHHLDDSLETFLINLSRGTGLDGLIGIPETNNTIIRPLLPFSKKEILSYADNNNIRWREDNSNSETKYLRNKIRHEIVPRLKELNSEFLSNFSKTTFFLKENQKITNYWFNKEKEKVTFIDKSTGNIHLKIDKLKENKQYLTFLFHFLKQYGFNNVQEVDKILNSQSGKKIFSSNFILLKNRNELIVKEKNKIKKCSFKIRKDENITHPFKLNFEAIVVEEGDQKTSIVIDENLVTFPLVLRKWEPGDVFYPTKMIGKKKVSKFFKDEKLSFFEKQEKWLLCTENKIIWIVGMRQDRRFLPLDKNSKKIKITTNI